MSGDKEQDYFADGLAEEIINALSKLSNVFCDRAKLLIQLQGRQVKASRSQKKWGFSMCWRGAYANGDKVRITANWSMPLPVTTLCPSRYERHLKDIFAIQDDVTMKVLTSLRVK